MDIGPFSQGYTVAVEDVNNKTGCCLAPNDGTGYGIDLLKDSLAVYRALSIVVRSPNVVLW